MKGKNQFTQEEINELKRLIVLRNRAERTKQKSIRQKMRNIGFYGMDDWGITDMQVRDLDNLIKSGRIKVINGISGVGHIKIKEVYNIVTPNIVKTNRPNAVSDITKNLIDGRFKKIAEIDMTQLSYSGLYCIKLLKKSRMPEKYNCLLKPHRIIYIGKADDLGRRFDQELFANGHGTFFRSIGAALGYRPQSGSLLNKRNQNNYTFSTSDEQKIIKWLMNSVEINWIRHSDLSDECRLIQEYRPLLNLMNNPDKLNILEEDREECRRIARGL